MKILALESSAAFASVCLLEDENVLSEFSVNAKLKHSHTLMPMTEYLLECSKCNIKDVDLFACSVGPGSFTGIRVGISAVKGMAMALSKPCIGVSSLKALAYSCSKNYCGYVICLMDAKCDRFYFAVFNKTEKLITRVSNDAIVKLENLADLLKFVRSKEILLLGDAAEVCYNELKSVSPSKGVTLLIDCNLPCASGVAKASREKFLKGEVTDAKKITANYFSVPRAQRELEIRMKEEGNGR